MVEEAMEVELLTYIFVRLGRLGGVVGVGDV